MHKIKTKLWGLMTFITITAGILSCSFFDSFDEKPDTSVLAITHLSLSRSTLSTAVGSMEYLSVNVKPADMQKQITLKWSYDSSIIECDISSSWGVTIKAIAPGQTTLKCSYSGYDSTCLVTVNATEEYYESTAEPYIYSNYSILQTSPGVTEKVFVSLYGGSAGDIDGYNWSVDNSSVATIQPTGQYCMVTAMDTGYARIKITHSKAAYPYYMGIYVFADATNVGYITTSNNIVTLNQDDGEKKISVSLVNGRDSSSDAQFRWEIINEDGSETPVTLSWNGNNAVITPKQGGSCTLRVTYPDAVYPLDILCRVITIVKNVYITPSTTVVTLTGDSEQTITCSLENTDSSYNIDGFEYRFDTPNVAEILNSVGNQVSLKGLANGSCKLIISHPKSAYSREVLVIVNGQLKDAVDASCYITTDQNYIRTKVGADGQSINISLKGGEYGDESAFTWSVASCAADGSSSKVINLETATGSVFHAESRSAAPTYAYGTAFMEPLTEGTAVITITHPKILYPTEILVKVLNKDAVLEEPLYFSGSGLMRILNGQNQDYTVQLKGEGKTDAEDQKISWNCNNPSISLAASGNKVNVTAPAYGSGCTTSQMTVSHPKVDNDKSVIIMTADNEQTLMSMKALYSDKLYYNLNLNDIATIIVNQVGFDTYDEETDTKTDYDFSMLKWTVKDSSIISVDRNNENPLICKIKALKAGQTTLTASIDSYSCDFKILVYPDGAIATEPEVYFTTSQNVVTLGGEGKTVKVNVSAVNLSSSEYSGITWTAEDDSVCSVIPNGTNATITAKKEGETIIKVTHPLSQNELKIYVRIGSEYVIPEAKPLVYISSNDIMTFLSDDPAQSLQAVLVNFNGDNSEGFSFSIDNESVAKITAQTSTGTAYIKPNGSGQAEITISHKATEITKKVLVIVGNSSEELEGFKYLTTGSNVISIGEGNTKSVSVSVKNADSPVLDGYTWVSSNPNVVDIIPSGATAVLKGNSIGTALITVTNSDCRYSLNIIAQVVDPIAAANNPYIQLSSSVLTTTVSTSYTSITADLIGGTKEDFSNFSWSVNDTSICAVYGQNEIGKIKALKAGQTYVTVSHPKSSYSAQILVVIEEETKSDCYISVPSSIITMKPNASGQSITASLINGSSTDKYSFSWNLDVYDIIDFQYSANVCTITPRQTGTATITISHPKAAYDQQVIVNVQEYSTFAFPQTSAQITQGTVIFQNMQVPTTSVTTHVEYSVDNPAICSITGTKSVAQLTGVSAGTTTVRANLVATSTGVVQASSEMLVYVKEAPANAVYITSGSTIFTVNKGKSQSLSATLSGNGITTTDQYNLKWKTNDTDIISITGISSDGSVTGQSIYVTAKKPGEALITCSHEKAASDLQFYVVVPGTGTKTLTLSKSYVTMLKGSSGSQIKASIENAEGTSDYANIVWSIDGVNGVEVARVMGSGQSVTIYPIAVGEATLMAQLSESGSVAKCTVIVEAGKSLSFDTSSRKVNPFHSTTIKYQVSPPNAKLTWTMSQDDDYFEFRDLGCDSNGNGKVEISGIKEGSGTLVCVTDGNAKAQCNVRVAWDYEFSIIGNTTFHCEPNQVKSFDYKVSPSDSVISVESTELDTLFSYEIKDKGDGTGTILIKAIQESVNDVSIKIFAKNPSKNYEVTGTKTITGKIAYQKLTPIVSMVSKSGNYSNWNNTANVLVLGDGETVNINFGILENNINGYIDSVIFAPSNGDNPIELQEFSATSTSKTYSIKDLQGDKIEYEYCIEKAYVPVKGGQVIQNWETDMIWVLENCHHDSGHCDFNFHMASASSSSDACKRRCRRYKLPEVYGMEDWYASIAEMYAVNSGQYQNVSGAGQVWVTNTSYVTHNYNDITYPDFYYGANFSLKEEPSLKGKIYTEEEFQRIGWFYCPGTRPQTQIGQGTDFAQICSMDYPLFDMGNCKGDHMYIKDFIMTKNVTAIRRESTDRTVKSLSTLGYLTVKINHMNSIDTMTIPVQYEVRNCAYNY